MAAVRVPSYHYRLAQDVRTNKDNKFMSSSGSITASEEFGSSPVKSLIDSMLIDTESQTDPTLGDNGATTTRYKRKRDADADLAVFDGTEMVGGIALSDKEFETLPKRRRKVEALLSPALFGPKWRNIVALCEGRYDISSYPWGENEINLDVFFQYIYGNAIRALGNMIKALRGLLGFLYVPTMEQDKLRELSAIIDELYETETRLTPDMPKTSLAFDVAVKSLTRIVHYAAARLSHRLTTSRYIELVTIVCMKMDESYCHLNSLNMIFAQFDGHIQRHGRRL